jgi:hypothetical protein
MNKNLVECKRNRFLADIIEIASKKKVYARDVILTFSADFSLMSVSQKTAFLLGIRPLISSPINETIKQIY